MPPPSGNFSHRCNKPLEGFPSLGGAFEYARMLQDLREHLTDFVTENTLDIFRRKLMAGAESGGPGGMFC